jgi:hypothetical protein
MDEVQAFANGMRDVAGRTTDSANRAGDSTSNTCCDARKRSCGVLRCVSDSLGTTRGNCGGCVCGIACAGAERFGFLRYGFAQVPLRFRYGFEFVVRAVGNAVGGQIGDSVAQIVQSMHDSVLKLFEF